MATWLTSHGATGMNQLKLLVLWQGTPGWFLGPGGVSDSGPQTAIWHTTITRTLENRVPSGATLTLTLDYDPQRGQVAIQGKWLGLSGNNVVFVNDVDRSNGVGAIGMMRVPAEMPGSSGQIGLVLRQSPEIMTFPTCDGTASGDRMQNSRLARLCLESIGATK